MRGERGSIREKGDAKFSGFHEVFTTETPVHAIEEKERGELVARIGRLQELHAKAVRGGELSAIERAERNLDAAVSDLIAYDETEDERASSAAALSYLPLADVLTMAGSGLPLRDDEQAARLDTLEVLLAYLFQDGVANPWEAFKNLLAVTRRIAPRYLAGADTQTVIGFLLGETRASPCAREKRVVERQLQRWGVAGFLMLGNCKTTETRRKLSEAQKGNRNRRGGRKRGRANQKPTTNP